MAVPDPQVVSALASGDNLSGSIGRNPFSKYLIDSGG